MLATVHSSYYKRCPLGAGIIPDFLMNVLLTVLSEDEQLFRDSCRSFAEERIRPLVRKMDEEAKLDDSAIPDLFQLGLMGLQIPEEFGGSSGTFFMSVLAVEEISRVDASFGVFIDVQNTLVNNAIMRWATDDQKREYLPRLAKDLVGAYALSEAGSGSDAFALACRASNKGDHFLLNGRSCGLRTPPKQTSSSCLQTPIRSRVTKGSPRFWLNAIFQDSPSGKRKINWASALRAPAN